MNGDVKFSSSALYFDGLNYMPVTLKSQCACELDYKNDISFHCLDSSPMLVLNDILMQMKYFWTSQLVLHES